MNSTLLGLAIVLVVALFTALIAPFLIDWSSYRGYVEQRVGEVLGRQVRIEGDLEVRLLPQPVIRASDLRAGDGETADVTVERIDLNLSLAPLLRGSIEIRDARITRPVVNLSVDDSGRLTLGMGGAFPMDPESVSLETVAVEGGTVLFDSGRSGRRVRFDNLTFTGSAGSLLGPFKAEGSVVEGGRLYTLRFQTGRITADGKLRAKLGVIPADAPLAFDSDGVLTLEEGVPEFAGQVRLEKLALAEGGQAAVPVWRIDATVAADGRKVVAEKLKLAFGDPAGGVVLEGDGDLTLGERPAASARLSTRQIDLDKQLGGGEPLDLKALPERLAALLPPVPYDYDVAAEIDIGGIVAGGALFESLSTAFSAADEAWKIGRFAMRGPGDTRMALSGTLSGGDGALAFEGPVALRSRNASTFMLAVSGQPEIPGLGRINGGVQADADVVLGPEKLALDSFRLAHPGGRITGTVALERPADARARLVLDLDAEALNADGLGNVVRGLAGGDAGLDIAARIEADRLVSGDTTMGGMSLDARYDGDGFELDRLLIADLDGARLSGGGRLSGLKSAPAGSISLDLSAQRLGGVAALLSAFGLGDAAAAIRERLEAMLPIEATLALAGTAESGATRLTFDLGADANGGRIEAKGGFEGVPADWRNGRLDLDAAAANEDGRRVLSLAGIAFAGADAGPGTASLKVDGIPGASAEISASLDAAGLAVSLDGKARIADGAVEFDGVRFEGIADDPVLLAAGFGIPAPGLPGGGEARAQATLSGNARRLDFAELSGDWQENAFTGALTVERGARAKASGRLQFDEASFPAVASLALGSKGLEGGNPWPATVLPQQIAFPADLDIEISAGGLELLPGVDAANSSFTVQLKDDGLALTRLQAALFGGSLTGQTSLRQGANGLTFDVNLQLTSARLEDFAWRRAGRPVASGSVDASIVAGGTARSIAGMVAGLGGSGSFRIRDGRIEGLNPAAFDEIVTAADAGLKLDEERVREVFGAHLASGPLRFQEAEGAFSVSGGVMRAERMTIDAQGLSSFLTGRVDLNSLSVDASMPLSTASEEDRAEGRRREAALVFSGPLADPRRAIDVSALMGYLTVRNFEQEVERLEQLQNDILERQRFSRELLRLGQDKRRREQAAEARADAERKAREDAERRKREAEEAARRAQEDAERRAREEAEKLIRDAQERAAREKAARENAASGGANGAPPDFATEMQRAIEQGEEPRPNASATDPTLPPLPPAVDIPSTGGNSAGVPGSPGVSQPPSAVGPQPIAPQPPPPDPFTQLQPQPPAEPPAASAPPDPPPPQRNRRGGRLTVDPLQGGGIR
ncbi:MAG: AsmA family protein [Flavobacteriaceae bacterium]